MNVSWHRQYRFKTRLPLFYLYYTIQDRYSTPQPNTHLFLKLYWEITPPDTDTPAQPPEEYTESVQTAGVGVVLHQPLKRQILVKNGDFRQNMNGIPVSLFRKSENAPTQRPQNGYFGTPIWG